MRKWRRFIFVLNKSPENGWTYNSSNNHIIEANSHFRPISIFFSFFFHFFFFFRILVRSSSRTFIFMCIRTHPNPILAYFFFVDNSPLPFVPLPRRLDAKIEIISSATCSTKLKTINGGLMLDEELRVTRFQPVVNKNDCSPDTCARSYAQRIGY